MNDGKVFAIMDCHEASESGWLRGLESFCTSVIADYRGRKGRFPFHGNWYGE
jgi:hypothetical protein